MINSLQSSLSIANQLDCKVDQLLTLKVNQAVISINTTYCILTKNAYNQFCLLPIKAFVLNIIKLAAKAMQHFPITVTTRNKSKNFSQVKLPEK